MSSNDPTVVVAQTLKRLYPHNPDVVLGREARTIVAALEEAGLSIVLTSDVAGVVDEIDRVNTKLASGVNLTRGIPTNTYSGLAEAEWESARAGRRIR